MRDLFAMYDDFICLQFEESVGSWADVAGPSKWLSKFPIIFHISVLFFQDPDTISSELSGDHFNRKTCSFKYTIPVIQIIQSQESIIFIMEISIPNKMLLILKQGSGLWEFIARLMFLVTGDGMIIGNSNYYRHNRMQTAIVHSATCIMNMALLLCGCNFVHFLHYCNCGSWFIMPCDKCYQIKGDLGLTTFFYMNRCNF